MNITKSDLIVLLAGPISNIPHGNVTLFNQSAREVKNMGIIVKNPHSFCDDLPRDTPWTTYLKRSIKELTDCTDIIVLSSWEESHGSMILMDLSSHLEIRIHHSLDSFKSFLETENIC